MAQKFLICAGLQADVRLFVKKSKGYPARWTINNQDAKLFSSEESAHKYAKYNSLDCKYYSVLDAKYPYARITYLFLPQD